MPYLGHDSLCHPFLFGCECQLFHPLLQRPYGHLHQFRDASSAHLHIVGLGLQPCAMTFGADGLSPVSGQHDPILNLVLSLTQHFEECVYAEQAPLLLLGE